MARHGEHDEAEGETCDGAATLSVVERRRCSGFRVRNVSVLGCVVLAPSPVEGKRLALNPRDCPEDGKAVARGLQERGLRVRISGALT